MKKAIIGRKVGMTQIFTEEGKVIPVTVIEAGPCTVTQKKVSEKTLFSSASRMSRSASSRSRRSAT